MSTADNFPALDLVDGNVRMRSRKTGNALDDLNAFDNALDAGERIDINIDGGTVYQVKSRAVSASEVVRQTTRDISNLASWTGNSPSVKISVDRKSTHLHSS